MGIEVRCLSRAHSRKSPRRSGCSIAFTFSRSRYGMALRASDSVQPPLPSTATRIFCPTVERTASTRAMSSLTSRPTLTFTALSPTSIAWLATRAASLGTKAPIENLRPISCSHLRPSEKNVNRNSEGSSRYVEKRHLNGSLDKRIAVYHPIHPVHKLSNAQRILADEQWSNFPGQYG